MVSWKSKYLEMKLKYINSKNKLKGGMDKRMKNFNNLPFDIKQQISYDATIKYANEEKKKVLDTITEDYSYLFTVDYTLKDLMINEGIEWKNIENIKNSSIQDIDVNSWYNYINIRYNLDRKIVLDTITEDYSYLFKVDYTLEDLMINEGIEWKNIEDIKNESIENINNNLWSNDISIRNSIELVNDDY